MEKLPTVYDNFFFQAKATCFRAMRGCRNSVDQINKWPCDLRSGGGVLLAESRSLLWDHSAPHAEKILQAGKVQNLRSASRALDGCRVPANRQFSFWSQIGRPGRLTGYVQGRELRQGCMIPSIGGGLCQLSNALFACALQAGFAIHERHAHTRAIPGSMTESGQDATVFWNYVDLRFSSRRGFRVGSIMTAADLIVRLWTCDEP